MRLAEAFGAPAPPSLPTTPVAGRPLSARRRRRPITMDDDDEEEEAAAVIPLPCCPPPQLEEVRAVYERLTEYECTYPLTTFKTHTHTFGKAGQPREQRHWGRGLHRQRARASAPHAPPPEPAVRLDAMAGRGCLLFLRSSVSIHAPTHAYAYIHSFVVKVQLSTPILDSKTPVV